MSMVVAAVAFTLAGAMPADPLEVGREYTIPLTFTVAEGWSVSDAGLPGAILQVDVPPGVELVEARADAKARKRFLQAPHERMLAEGGNELTFKLTGKLAADAALSFNVLGYCSDGSRVRFLRQRYRVPLKPGAALAETNVNPSTWGTDQGLQLGDKLPAYELPQADGSVIKLADYIGKSNIVITTYRAFW